MRDNLGRALLVTIVLLALASSACVAPGGGTGNPQDPPTVVTTVVGVGDSLARNQHWPLVEALTNAGRNVEGASSAYNFAFGAAVTDSFAVGVPGSQLPVVLDALEHLHSLGRDIVIEVALGGNDLGHAHVLEGLEYGTQEWTDHFAELAVKQSDMIAAMHQAAPNAQIINLPGVLPSPDETYPVPSAEDPNRRLPCAEVGMTLLGTADPRVYYNTLLPVQQFLAGQHEYMRFRESGWFILGEPTNPDLMDDCVHPAPAGRRLVAEEIVTWLEE